MSEFEPGGVVWVKCGSHYWPGEVKAFEELPPHVAKDFEERPECIVKFFDEDGYEFLSHTKGLFPYNCHKKEEFIKKGLVKSRRTSKEGSSWFAKFPNDIVRCEILTKGDPNLLEKEPYIEKNERVNYKEIFKSNQDSPNAGNSASPLSSKRRKRNGGTSSSSSGASSKRSRTATAPSPKRPISHPRFKPGASDHKIKILPQPSSPYHLDLAMKQEKAAQSSANNYTCSICGFSASRLNVIILHNKSHSSGALGGRSSGSPSNGKGSSPKKNAPHSSQPVGQKKNNSKKAPSKGPSKKKPPPPSPRLTKKAKEEKAREEEEMKVERRKKILDDWSDDDEDEAAKGAPSEEDEEMEDEVYMGDDHLHQNCSDDEEPQEEESKDTEEENNGKDNNSNDPSEEEEEEKTDKSRECSTVEEDKVTNTPQHSTMSSKLHEEPAAQHPITSSDKEKEEVEEESHKKELLLNSNSSEEEPSKDEGVMRNGGSHHSEEEKNSTGELKDEDISKVLEETEVPSLPEDLKELEDSSKNKCSSQSMRVMAPKSPEEEDPWDVKDEFMDDRKKGATPSLTSEEHKEKSGEESKIELESKAASDSVGGKDLLPGGGEEDTYILLVDDGSGTVDSLDSQTLYIDPNSLASGDLSNMVLMTSEGKTKAVSAGSSSGNKDILALAIQQQQIVTTVDTSGGVAIVPGIASSSSLAKVPLISTRATPSAPLMTTSEVPSPSSQQKQV